LNPAPGQVLMPVPSPGLAAPPTQILMPLAPLLVLLAPLALFALFAVFALFALHGPALRCLVVQLPWWY
ncbi:hypothetical protein, partial [Arthrobacter sp. E3]|uniref:hypothetical protein n=1 Tax=Arthrobacter sp. E3 TaxID=517402 RepID=UPI001A94F8D0